MKKLFLIFTLAFLVSMPLLATAASDFIPIVQCGNSSGDYQTPCTLADLIKMVVRVYKFMVYDIALPIAGILIVVSGILMIISAGNPSRFEKGKSMLRVTAIAILIIFGSWLIVNATMTAIGYPLRWWVI